MNDLDRQSLLQRLRENNSRRSERDDVASQLRLAVAQQAASDAAPDDVLFQPEPVAASDGDPRSLASVLARRAPRRSRAELLARLSVVTGHVEGASAASDSTGEFDDAWEDVNKEDLGEHAWRAQFSGPVPNYERQVALAKAIEAGLFAQAVLEGDLLRTSGTRQELESVAREGRAALEDFLTGNLRLVVHWALRSAPQLEVQDKFQYGTFGLWRAVEMWDWRRGYTFGTYASFHIRQAIARGVANDAYTIRLPVHVQDRMRASNTNSTQDRGLEPDAAQRARLVVQGIYSLDDLEDYLAENSDEFDYRCVDPSEWIDDRIANEDRVRIAFRSLSEREVRILEQRSGMYAPPVTLDEIGQREGVTRERIRQIEGAAEQTIRSQLWSDYSDWEADRAVFRQADQENPKIVEALIAVQHPHKIARTAKAYDVDPDELLAALKRVRAATD